MDRFVSEEYFKLGDLPVMVCVLVLSNGGLSVGYSVSRPEKFDDETARFFAKRSATRLQDNFVKRRAERETA